MKNYLKKSAIFLIPIIFILVTNEIMVRTIPNEYTTKIKQFEHQAPEINVLIFGNSHGLRGIDPHCFQNKRAFNLAMVSQPIALDHRLLFKYKEKLPQLKYIILSISYSSLSEVLTAGEIKERLPYYKHFYKLEMKELKPTSPDYYFVQFAADFKGTASRLYKFITGVTIVKTDTLGWMGAENKQLRGDREFIDGATLAAKRHENNSFDFYDNITLLKEIIDFGEKSNIKVILVNTPKTEWYNSLLNPEKSILIDKSIEDVIRGTNALYLDLKEDSNFDLSDFRNSDHLNEKGAKKLSHLLEKYIH